MEKWATPQIRTSVLISPEFYKLCKEQKIRFSEALRVGISIILAERGIQDYDNSLNIVRRVNDLKQKAAQYAQTAADMENKLEKEEKPAPSDDGKQKPQSS